MRSYDPVKSQAAEDAKFARAGFDRASATEKLNAALREMGSKSFNMDTGEDSVHWLLFAALSETSKGRAFRNILEIGTFRGKTAALLKRLFPEAQVFTCDLPLDDPIYANSYRRNDPAVFAEHTQKRNENVSQDGITLIEANSFFLPERLDRTFDMIWVDGGHLYPEVAWDTCNAWHLCRPGGYILFDDVFDHPKGGDGMYGNGDAHDVIQYLAARANVEPVYFLKRTNPLWSAEPRRRKYVVMLRKPFGGRELNGILEPPTEHQGTEQAHNLQTGIDIPP